MRSGHETTSRKKNGNHTASSDGRDVDDEAVWPDISGIVLEHVNVHTGESACTHRPFATQEETINMNER
jgi:hypothetical protein